MLLTAQVRPEKQVIPAVTHLDGSARLQTVTRAENGLFYDLISEFDRQTGVPVIINTSYNVRGEPIILSPEDAFRCFMRTKMDALVMHDCVVLKRDVEEEAEVARREIEAFARQDEGQALVTA
jgi:carbamoyltransferase